MVSVLGLAQAGSVFAALLLHPALATAEPSQSWPIQVTADYKLAFTGVGDVGKLRFHSKIAGTAYTSDSHAEIKIPLVYKWSGNMNGSGAIGGDVPKPLSYLFTSQSKALIGETKNGSVRLGFKDHAISQVTILPPPNPVGATVVPIQPQHMQEAFDPLTAVMMLTRSNGNAPCSRRIPVFDGRHRFDLVMTTAGQQKVPELRPSGQPSIGFVCKVRFIPIAGHKDNEDTKKALESTKIEVILRSVPSAGLLVPYKVTVGTKYGTGTMMLQRMDIVAPGQKQIALVH